MLTQYSTQMTTSGSRSILCSTRSTTCKLASGSLFRCDHAHSAPVVRYTDSKCVFHLKPLFESGTLVTPHPSCCHSDSGERVSVGYPSEFSHLSAGPHTILLGGPITTRESCS